MMRKLIAASRQNIISRRAALAGVGGTAAALGLAACAPASTPGSSLTPATDMSDSEKVLTWHNWPLYIDEDDSGSYPTLQRFEAETGIKVEYLIEINDNDEYYGKVKDQLALGQDIGADLTTPTSWLAARIITLGYVQKLDDANIPNKKNLDPTYLGVSYDPNREYSMPYQGIFAGIGYHKGRYKELTGQDAPTGIDDLWNPVLKGKVGALTEMRDTLGLILIQQGIKIGDSASLTEESFNAALEYFSAKATESGLRIKGNNYAEDLVAGNTVAAMTWSGDISILNYDYGTEEDPEPFGFLLPPTGYPVSADTWMIPMGATHKKNAEALINFYYDPVNAAELAAWVNYITPVLGAKEVMAESDPDLASNELIFPTESTMALAQSFRALTGQEEQRFSAAWQNFLLGAG